MNIAIKYTPISTARWLREQGLYYVTPSLLADLLDIERQQAYRLLYRLEDQDLVSPVENGKYLLLGLESEMVLSNPLFIASQLVAPCYISYWSALHYHGLTEQVPRVVFVATTRKKRPVEFRGQFFRYVTLKPHKFFGYEREDLGGLPVVVADEAKTLVDSLHQPRYAGGVVEVARSLATALPELDLDMLVEYANRMEDGSLASRLGYLLEQLGHPVAALDISSGPVLLDPRGEAGGQYSARWRVRVNLPADALFAEGVG